VFRPRADVEEARVNMDDARPVDSD